MDDPRGLRGKGQGSWLASEVAAPGACCGVFVRSRGLQSLPNLDHHGRAAHRRRRQTGSDLAALHRPKLEVEGIVISNIPMASEGVNDRLEPSDEIVDVVGSLTAAQDPDNIKPDRAPGLGPSTRRHELSKPRFLDGVVEPPRSLPDPNVGRRRLAQDDEPDPEPPLLGVSPLGCWHKSHTPPA